ncbi:MAG: CDP-glycerol glycerophosphotransferase family protein [Campylobacterota bacterium]|nr:CDP-glycerol glycerophosphotransferase family protein [Campylobacterota bacterium]
MLNIYFYVAYPYYFPHFLPIGKVFQEKGDNVKYILSSKQNSDNMKNIAQENSLIYSFDMDELYDEKADAIFFANPFEKAKDIEAVTIFLEHGIGTKSTSFYNAIEYFDIYIVEGEQKYNLLKELYPQFEHKLAKVGFSKFDEIINFKEEDKTKIFKKYNLDLNKKTILYAPTFFPSSIEKMSDSFPQEFTECNILVKPHYLSYERKKYKNQLKKFKKWKEYNNCIVLPLNEYNLVPFLAISDIMISDESSAMFEFAALNKPVISNRYFKLRWSYYLMPWKLSKRIDKSKEFYRTILDNAYDYKETLHFIQEALANPLKLENKRLEFSKDLCGEIDGNVSSRIYERVIKKLNETKNI